MNNNNNNNPSYPFSLGDFRPAAQDKTNPYVAPTTFQQQAYPQQIYQPAYQEQQQQYGYQEQSYSYPVQPQPQQPQPQPGYPHAYQASPPMVYHGVPQQVYYAPPTVVVISQPDQQYLLRRRNGRRLSVLCLVFFIASLVFPFFSIGSILASTYMVGKKYIVGRKLPVIILCAFEYVLWILFVVFISIVDGYMVFITFWYLFTLVFGIPRVVFCWKFDGHALHTRLPPQPLVNHAQ